MIIICEIAQRPHCFGQHWRPRLRPITVRIEIVRKQFKINVQQRMPRCQVHDAAREVVVVPPAPGGGQHVVCDVGQRAEKDEVEIRVPAAVLWDDCTASTAI